MAHVPPVNRESVEGLAAVFDGAEAAMGFVPNSMLTMAHMPQLPMAFMMLTSVVFGADLKGLVTAFAGSVPDQGEASENLPPALVQLIAYAASVTAGCRYCQAHTSHSAHRLGEDADKFAHILEYETHPEYSPAERAVVAIALAAGQVPNEASSGHFDALREHFSERQIVQIVGVIAMFGFLNRWNDTMATTLETDPAQFGSAALGPLGWSAGKHAAG